MLRQAEHDDNQKWNWNAEQQSYPGDFVFWTTGREKPNDKGNLIKYSGIDAGVKELKWVESSSSERAVTPGSWDVKRS